MNEQLDHSDEFKASVAFVYHSPDEAEIARCKKIRTAARKLANVILEECPQCVDRTEAVRKVREAVMTANASIALKGVV